MKDYVKDLYERISENIGETPEEFHYDYFKLEVGELYYKGKRKPLTLNRLVGDGTTHRLVLSSAVLKR